QSIATSGGQPYRIVHECRKGDVVVYRRGQDVHIGRIEGDYEYRPALSPAYPDQRGVTWLKTVAASLISTGALHEAGSAMSFFSIRNYADEYLALLKSEATELAETPQEAEEVTYVVENITQETRAF